MPLRRHLCKELSRPIKHWGLICGSQLLHQAAECERDVVRFGDFILNMRQTKIGTSTSRTNLAASMTRAKTQTIEGAAAIRVFFLPCFHFDKLSAQRALSIASSEVWVLSAYQSKHEAWLSNFFVCFGFLGSAMSGRLSWKDNWRGPKYLLCKQRGRSVFVRA